MLRKLTAIFVLALILSSCVACTKDYVYENSVFRVVLKERNNELVSIELINRQTASTYSAIPKLMIYDDGLPLEGGLVADYNKLIDNDLNSCSVEDLYSCDSVYGIEDDLITICFGRESRSLGQIESPNKRLDLNIRDSRLTDFVDGDYTLYTVKE